MSDNLQFYYKNVKKEVDKKSQLLFFGEKQKFGQKCKSYLYLLNDSYFFTSVYIVSQNSNNFDTTCGDKKKDLSQKYLILLVKMF